MIDSANQAGGKGVRQRSTVVFPYMPLDEAIVLAEAIHTNAGTGICEDHQLAAWVKRSQNSSGFRVQSYTARTFGLVELLESSKCKLTPLGQRIVDPKAAREARVEAFLNVPLYRQIFEAHKSGVLPPAAALETELISFGVAEKQKTRARQVFERSAEQAGFFEHGKNRLVMPGVVHRTLGINDPPVLSPNLVENVSGSHVDPLIEALIQKLPDSSNPTLWSPQEQVMWLRMMAMAFQMVYRSTTSIEIDLPIV